MDETLIPTRRSGTRREEVMGRVKERDRALILVPPPNHSAICVARYRISVVS